MWVEFLCECFCYVHECRFCCVVVDHCVVWMEECVDRCDVDDCFVVLFEHCCDGGAGRVQGGEEVQVE